MKAFHHRIGKDVKFSNATIFMANERENVTEAYPGDIIGIYNHGTIKIGDTFMQGCNDQSYQSFTSFCPFVVEVPEVIEILSSLMGYFLYGVLLINH